MSVRQAEVVRTVFRASFLRPELKKRVQKAQDKGDLGEESKLCNAIGEKYFQIGEVQFVSVFWIMTFLNF